MIAEFSGEYRFLSNFWPCTVTIRGWIDDPIDETEYPSVEHAYQAAKTLDRSMRQHICNQISPGRAKKIGKTIELRPDWEEIKIEVMGNLLIEKFKHPALNTMLLATKPHMLMEGNHWGDTFWGVCNGLGSNHLGRILMEIRDGTYFTYD